MPDQIQIIPQPTSEKLTQVNEVLFEFDTVFPFDFSPDKVVLDRFKINVIKKDILGNERITTIPLGDEVSVKINSGPVTSQIVLTAPEQGQVQVENVTKDDATHFRELVEGMVIGMRLGVNLLTLSKEELIEQALNWGAVQT